MFQFTTTTVINSNFETGYNPTGEDLVDAPHALWAAVADKQFNVKRVGNFLKDYVTAVYENPAVPAELAEVKIDLNTLTDVATVGAPYRLNILIGLSEDDHSSYYSTDYYYKGKPFYIDFVWKGAAKTAADIKKMIDKYMLVVLEKPLVKITQTGSTLTITATNEFQRFKKVAVEKFDAEAYGHVGDYIELDVEGLVTVVKKGVASFGSYSWLLRNLRLPTSMRTRAFGVNQEENPILGAMYDQFTIHYCKNRGILGSNAVGDTVTSATTHVFYVNKTLSKDFKEALVEAFGEGKVVLGIPAKGVEEEEGV